MEIVITLDTKLETLLRARAAQEGQDVSFVASELLARILAWEAHDSEEAIEGIQRGLDDFDAGQFRSFQAFAEEQRQKYDLPSDS